MDDDDIQLSENNCPKCDHHTYWRECTAIGCDDGWIDMHEYDDPLWYDPGEFEPCEECQGRGCHNWCPNCGWDLFEEHYLSGQPAE